MSATRIGSASQMPPPSRTLVPRCMNTGINDDTNTMAASTATRVNTNVFHEPVAPWEGRACRATPDGGVAYDAGAAGTGRAAGALYAILAAATSPASRVPELS